MVTWRRAVKIGCGAMAAVVVVWAMAMRVGATPSLGFVVNQILASGTAADGIGQQVQIGKKADGGKSNWQLQLQVQGDTDHYSQNLVLAPGGYSGWHSHPGLLIGTVKSGQVDFYTADCTKRTIHAGEVYTENDEVHAIVNTGAENADLYISYLVKHGQPRRLDEAAPDCAAGTPIP